MAHRQQIYPWQNYGTHDNASSTTPASKPSVKQSQKRQRCSANLHAYSAKRHQPAPQGANKASSSTKPAGGAHPPTHDRRRFLEVINLLNEDDDLPPRPKSNETQPKAYTPGVDYPPLPGAGNQQRPYQIDDHVPPPLPKANEVQLGFYQPAVVDYPQLPGMSTQQRPYRILEDSVPEKSIEVDEATATRFAIEGPTPEFKPLVNSFHATAPASPHKQSPQRKKPAVPADNPATDIVPIVEPTLCKEQADLVDLILSGRNVFYTGSAGCGKSTVLKAFVKRFKERGMKVDILAPTGRAALDINGSTTWTYAGWTPDANKKELKKIKEGAHGKFVRNRLKETDILVIDEISMVENFHFERINFLMKEARDDDRAFGGVQIVVTGDFCQLPPVKPFGHCYYCGRELIKNREETEYRCRQHGVFYDADKWAFRSKAWEECSFEHVNLTEIHRQSDRTFIDILNKLRMGTRLLQSEVDLLLDHKSETRNAIQLFATRREVQLVNDQRFKALRSVARTYQCFDHFHWNEKHGNLKMKGELRAFDGSLQALAEHRYESRIQLKQGMLVVLLHNLDLNAGLVNGSQGTIQGFEPYDPNKIPRAATTRDKRDGITMGSHVLTGDHAAFREQRVADYAKQMEYKAWPIVQFLNGVKRTIYAECTVNSLGDTEPHSLLSRTQIPLMAAWAMTTHKSQGMTLNRVVVDLSNSFETGMGYVALSRAKSLDGLKVTAFPQSAQKPANAQVKAFLGEKFGI